MARKRLNTELGDESMDDAEVHRSVCARFGASFLATDARAKLGIALRTLGQVPLNGLRHPPEASTCGWYIWAGETLSKKLDFWQAMHASHLRESCPEVLPYLGLGPGWRFLIAPGHEDVGYDESLLHV